MTDFFECPYCAVRFEKTGKTQLHVCGGPQELADRLNPPTLRALLAFWWRRLRSWWNA